MNIDDEKQQPGAETNPAQDDVERNGKLRALFAKRWAFPALYLTAAVMIIAFMYFQATRLTGGPTTKTTATPTVTTSANAPWIWPVGANAKNITLLRGYYDRLAQGATVASLSKDLIVVGNSYQGSTGYDIGATATHAKHGFPVVASVAGTVSSVRTSPTFGETVEVSSPSGYHTLYRSLGTVDVQTGAHVLQGQQLGTSGTNSLEANMGNHLFFEVERNGIVVDPGSVLPKLPS